MPPKTAAGGGVPACIYYRQGNCTYGSRCHFEHVKRPKPGAVTQAPQKSAQAAAASTATPSGLVVLRRGPPATIAATAPAAPAAAPTANAPLLSFAAALRSTLPPDEQPPDAASQMSPPDPAGLYAGYFDPMHGANHGEAALLCPYAFSTGVCHHGDQCRYTHGTQCPCCQMWCLHPDFPAENQAHVDACVAAMESDLRWADLVAASESVECCICLETVLQKEGLHERRFGILSGCTHAFCLRCIRGWRATGEIQETTVRACPICREPSHYVIPSSVWVTDPDAKRELNDAYRSKMSAIDCKYFNFGTGSCQFGSSCFYRHADRYGRIQEATKVRYRVGEDETAAPVTNVRLWDFLEAWEDRRVS